MPIYVYHCEDCDNVKEELHGWEEEGYPTPCPECGSKNLRRIPGLPQRPKVHGSDTKPQDRWGYNKTTTDYWFDGEGKRVAIQYDENKRKSQVKEAAKKEAGKGKTISMSGIKKKK